MLRMGGTMSRTDVIIRPATESDLPILNQEVRPEYGRTNNDDLHNQQEGRLTFVTAWLRKLLKLMTKRIKAKMNYLRLLTTNWMNYDIKSGI